MTTTNPNTHGAYTPSIRCGEISADKVTVGKNGGGWKTYQLTTQSSGAAFATPQFARYSISNNTLTLTFTGGQITAGTSGSGEYRFNVPPGVLLRPSTNGTEIIGYGRLTGLTRTYHALAAKATVASAFYFYLIDPTSTSQIDEIWGAGSNFDIRLASPVGVSFVITVEMDPASPILQ